MLAGLAIALLPLSWVLYLILATGALVVILLRPVVGLYLLVFAIPFGSLREVSLGVLNIGGAEALAVLTVTAWVVQMLARREIKTVLAPLVLPLLLFLSVASLSVMGALSLQWSGKGLLIWVEVLAVYLLVVNLVDFREARVIVILVLLAGCLEALLGIYQFFGRVGPEGFVLMDRFMRAYGTFDQPNPYGGYLALILPLAVGLFTARAARRDLWALIGWALASVSLALMGAALVMSWSRGAWLGFAAGLALVAMAGLWYKAFSPVKGGILGGLSGAVLGSLWLNAAGVGKLLAPVVGALSGLGMGMGVSASLRHRWLWMLAAVVLLLVVMLIALGGDQLVPTVVAQRFSDFIPYLRLQDVRGLHVTDENFAVVERLAHWEAALGMLQDRPLLGVGIGNYVPVYPAHALPGWRDPLGHAHNYYLHVAAETGLVGLAAYLFLLFACFRQGWLAVRSLTGIHQGVALGILGVLGAFAVHSLFDNLYVHGMNIHLAMLLGLLYVLTRRRGGSLDQAARNSPQ